MKEKTRDFNLIKILPPLVALLLCLLCVPTFSFAEASVGTDAPTVSLDAAFSDEGMATEIDCAYGKKLIIPNPIALSDGKRIDAKTTVTYLAADGWEEYELSENRVLTVGDANSGDENKVAMYKVTFSAEANGKTTELFYTVYAGLQFSNRAAWANSDAVGFVGEEIGVPTTKIQYKYKNEANKTVTTPLEPVFTLIYYAENSEKGEVIELNGALSFTPDRAGRYEAVYATPETVEIDGKIYIRGSQSLARVINVYEQRSNPIDNDDGIYECAYVVGGTSDTGKGMIASSCDSRIQIEKTNGLYYMHFTQIAANYMFNLKMTVGEFALGNLIVREQNIGAQSIREYVITMDENALKSEVAVSMYIGPMSRDVNFTIKADIDNAYCVSNEITDSGERPALYVPVINANSATIIRAVGTTIEIPTATAMLGSEKCNVVTSVYYNGDVKENIAIENNSFTPTKTGTYYIVYTATSESYKTSAGNPSKTIFERQVTVGRSGDITPTDPDNEKPDDTNITDNDNDPSKNDKPYIWIIVGCVAGAAVLLLAGLSVWLVVRKRK
ncbi:MAG: hypothetical protein ACLTEK_03555 [Christensenellales bacterium]